MEAGLDPVAAVHALTLGAARIFGVDDRVGSVEVGKIANLTVTEGGLFDEDSSVKMVFVDGQRFEAEQGGGASSGRGGGGVAEPVDALGARVTATPTQTPTQTPTERPATPQTMLCPTTSYER